MNNSFNIDTSSLKTDIQSSGITSISYSKRLANIEWIKSLNRDKLNYKGIERQILIYKTEHDELIYLQYPGKEAAREKSKRPWDFRPKLKNEKGYIADLSFTNIWEELYGFVYDLRSDVKEALRVFSIILYRLAFMIDHEQISNNLFEASSINFSTERISGKNLIDGSSLFVYNPPLSILKELEIVIPKLNGMSLEGFLYYNDLLSLQEDTKYYYRNFHEKKNNKWINKTGRINNILTHINLIGVIIGEMQFSKFIGTLQRGVAAITNDDLKLLFKDLINLKEKKSNNLTKKKKIKENPVSYFLFEE